MQPAFGDVSRRPPFTLKAPPHQGLIAASLSVSPGCCETERFWAQGLFNLGNCGGFDGDAGGCPQEERERSAMRHVPGFDQGWRGYNCTKQRQRNDTGSPIGSGMTDGEKEKRRDSSRGPSLRSGQARNDHIGEKRQVAWRRRTDGRPRSPLQRVRTITRHRISAVQRSLPVSRYASAARLHFRTLARRYARCASPS